MKRMWTFQGSRCTLGIAAAMAAAGTATILAHKPITSKYTYNEQVFPILRDRCGSCHVEGGVGPMSLMTYRDAFPWAESIRSELVAGHMPPWTADAGGAPFRGARVLSPRELDVLVTWATGGTPEGPPGAKPPVIALERRWPLGEPSLTLSAPESMALAAGQTEATREFVLPDGALVGRAIRAIDLLPETPAIVRRAVFIARPAGTNGAGDRVIAAWLPGGDTVPAPEDAGFVIPPGASLIARVTLKKTWKYENTPVTDRSRIGVYFARSPGARAIDAVRLGAEETSIDRDAEAVAIRLDAPEADDEVTVRAIRPDGSVVGMLRAMTAPDWPRRYWFEQPIALPRGTRLEVTATGRQPAPVVVLDCLVRP